MANKKTKKTEKRTSSNWLINNLSLIAIIIMALVLLIGAIMKFLPADLGLGNIVSIMKNVAMIIAICVTLLHSFYAARHKGKKMFIVWIGAAVLVVLSYILGLI